MTGLVPAAQLATQASKPYPGDSAEYRKARTALLAQEIELRRHIERIAAMRRALPPGGEVKPYKFLDKQGKERSLADLFGAHDTPITYFWMYGPERERPCRSPVARQLAFAIERGWRFLDFYQCVGDDFPTDYRGLRPNGEEWPQLDVSTRRGGTVNHFMMVRDKAALITGRKA